MSLHFSHEVALLRLKRVVLKSVKFLDATAGLLHKFLNRTLRLPLLFRAVCLPVAVAHTGSQRGSLRLLASRLLNQASRPLWIM